MTRAVVWLMFWMAGWLSVTATAPVAKGATLPSAQPWHIQRPDSPDIAPHFLTMLSKTRSDDSLAVWVFFTDKGLLDERSYQQAVRDYDRTLTAHARLRRMRRRTGDLVDIYDLPLFDPYVQQIVASGVRLRGRSRWLNAISITATPEMIRQFTKLPFVRTIKPVAAYRRPLFPSLPDDTRLKPLTPAAGQGLNYGPAARQLTQLHVPELHDLGLSGRGVIIAILDTGYNLDHVAFDSLRTRVIAERDFINGDDQTADNPAQDVSGQHNHGTETLSTIGGYAPGDLIGPAYGAHFLLAKTETIAFEQQIEEDWWVQGVEWADSMGADIVSSSLGYNVWYQFSDMDGRTAVTTQAATIAVSRGIVVVNSMGNEGQSLWQKMIAPADAEGVISVGAVDSTGRRAAFSSRGPTFDGRIKPDVVAMGVAVRVANPNNTTGYLRVNGTSFSAPLTAGVAALLLEAQPTWPPAQVLNALRSTAGQASTPDTLTGYGVVNALAALFTGSDSRITDFTASNDSSGVLLEWGTTFELNIQGWRLTRTVGAGGASQVLTPALIPASGAGVSGVARTYFFLDTAASAGVTYDYTLEPVNTQGIPVTTLSRFASITYIPSTTSNLPQFSLYQNFPNPFNPSTRIAFDLRYVTHVTLAIYNLLGQQVRLLVNEQRGAGHYEEPWDGTDASGRPLASGLYFYRLKADTFVSAKKMTLIR